MANPIIIRVFPRRTSATPTDRLAFVGDPPLLRPAANEVHISCTFTWDIPEATHLLHAWQGAGYKTRLGGPALGTPNPDFVAGLYVKHGMTFTSRGCIRRCPFCLVPHREGPLQLLHMVPGWDILDNNLLACPRSHIEAVLDMLAEQPKPARFTGGIDSRLCQPWFVRSLAQMRLDILYTAYDSPAERPHIERTIKSMRNAGISQRKVGCYVLCGYDGDTRSKAEERLEWVFGIGGMPFAMFYRPATEHLLKIPGPWRPLIRQWSRPAAIFASHPNA